MLSCGADDTYFLYTPDHLLLNLPPKFIKLDIFTLSLNGSRETLPAKHTSHWYYNYIICHLTIADEPTNILLNFTMLFMNAIDTYEVDIYIYTLRRLLSVPSKCVP